jgi:hypothetical protein
MSLRRLAFIVLVVGCSFESTAPLVPVANACADDSDCVRGICNGDICIDDTNAFVEIAVEVVSAPSDSASPVPASWAFATERFSGSTVRDWVLPATREVRGSVRWDGEPVPASIRFVRQMSDAVLPLNAIPVTVDTARGALAGDSASFDFSVSLVEGETYDVAILPTEDLVTSPTEASAPAIRSLPPIYLQKSIRGGDPAEPIRLDVEFPVDLAAPCSVTKTTGCTLEGNILTFDGETDAPEAGLQVRAVDKRTGLVVSSIGETSEAGTFAIRVGPNAPEYSIRVTSSLGRAPFPSVSVDPDLLFSEQSPTRVIRIPRLDPVQYSGRVRDEAGAPVPGASIRFLSGGIFDGSQLGLVGSFTGSATTNEDGSFRVQLLPGLYSVVVTPPEEEESSWGVLASEALVVDEAEASDTFIVPSKLTLGGTVTTFNDERAAGVTLLARARQTAEQEMAIRSQEVVSEVDGLFRMQMDRGLYDLHVKIPEDTGYGWLVEPGLLMEEDVLRSYRLPPPVSIEGELFSYQSAPVSGAQLRAYILRREGSETRLLQVAETTTDEAGKYRLLIAPRLGAL